MTEMDVQEKGLNIAQIRYSGSERTVIPLITQSPFYSHLIVWNAANGNCGITVTQFRQRSLTFDYE
jgi:hypothetical protein